LLLIVESGEWQVADIRVTTDNDAGYSPNYTRIKTPITTTHKIDNQISFKAEYYNVVGERSKQISYVYNKDWEGGNRYIDGNFSMLTGSLYVADSLNSGVAISGYPNSGFIRSLGYEGFDAGFPGFLLWSGSALPGQTSKGQLYNGVGLELYANTSSYFRYSTKDSEIDVRTDKFFFGNPSSSFISGSNGLLQISSSNFILSPQGNVTASNGEFRGTSLSDFYQFRSIRIQTATLTNLSEYTEGGLTYYALNLTGSYDPANVSTGPGMFIRIEAALQYPIGAINIHTASYPKYQDYASFVVIEVATSAIYFKRGPNAAQSPLNAPDSKISVDTDDWIYPAFISQLVPDPLGVSYPQVFKATNGNRIFFAQSVIDWKIQTVSSYDTITPKFPIGLIVGPQLSDPTSPAAGQIIVSGSGVNQHAYCYLNGAWQQLDN
jgi:hypothetical protein